MSKAKIEAFEKELVKNVEDLLSKAFVRSAELRQPINDWIALLNEIIDDIKMRMR